MFDQQLDIFGGSKDLAPKHEQPRMFEFPKTTPGQLPMGIGQPVSFDIGRRIVTGTITRFHANATKAAVLTDGGEYVLPMEYLR